MNLLRDSETGAYLAETEDLEDLEETPVASEDYEDDF